MSGNHLSTVEEKDILDIPNIKFLPSVDDQTSTMDWTLSWCRGLCGSIISRAVLTGVHTPGRFNHVREVLSESPDKSSPGVS